MFTASIRRIAFSQQRPILRPAKAPRVSLLVPQFSLPSANGATCSLASTYCSMSGRHPKNAPNRVFRRLPAEPSAEAAEILKPVWQKPYFPRWVSEPSAEPPWDLVEQGLILHPSV